MSGVTYMAKEWNGAQCSGAATHSGNRVALSLFQE